MSDSPAWIDEKGRINEPLFCLSFVHNDPLKYISGNFYGLNGVVDEKLVEHEVYEAICNWVSCGIDRKVNALTSALKKYCYSEPLKPDVNTIHLQNGTLSIDGVFTHKKQFCINRLNAEYISPDPDKQLCPKYKKYVAELLYPEDIPTIQEYLGYCLIPSTAAQKALVILGNGGEGKSTLGDVEYGIIKDSCCEGKIARIDTDKFFRHNLKDKLVLIDDDLQMRPLSSTQYLKTLITASRPINTEKKGDQSVDSMLYTRIICFGNGMFTAMHDQSVGFSRRFIIIRVKPKQQGRNDDPHLAEKLLEEKNEIFLWMFEGLKRLIANDFKFTISERTQRNIEEAFNDNCNLVDYIEDNTEVAFGASYSESTASLYESYSDWCDKNGLTALRRDDVTAWLKTNSEKYGIKFSNHVKNAQGREVRGFQGIRCCRQNSFINNEVPKPVRVYGAGPEQLQMA